MTAVSSTPRAASARLRSTGQLKTRTLGTSVRRGAIWNVASTILLRISSIGITALVARILTPHDFGVFAVATTAFTIVTAFGELGVTSCLARADLSVGMMAPTLWTVSLGTSFLMAGVLDLFAQPIATALGSSQAAGPIRVMSLLMLLWGVAAVPTAQCVRDFKQDKIFLANVLSFIPSTILLIVLAKHGSGAMAFAWSRVAGQVVSCVVVLLSVPKLHLPGLRRSALSVLYRYGLPLACANFIGYILQNTDYALIGRLLGPVRLGTYVLAFNAASWSSALLLSVLGTVAMPAFSRVKDDRDQLMAAAANGLRAVMLVAAPMCMLVMVFSKPIVLTLYGSHWAAAAPVLSILSIYGLISIVGMLFSNMLAALGRSKSVLAVQLIWLVALVPAMAIGVHRGGIVGAAIAHIVIITPVVLPCYLVALVRATGVRVGFLAKAAFPPLVISAIAAAVAWLVAEHLNRPIVQLAAGMSVGGLLYLLATAPQLIPLLGGGLAGRPSVRRVLRFYRNIGRAIGIPIGPPPRHVRRHRSRVMRTGYRS